MAAGREQSKSLMNFKSPLINDQLGLILLQSPGFKDIDFRDYLKLNYFRMILQQIIAQEDKSFINGNAYF